MKKIFLILGFLGIFFCSSNISLAASCTWTKSKGIIAPGTVGAVWSCPDSNTKESENVSACSGKIPGLDYLCCCLKEEIKASPEKPTIFEMADLQVEIPGMKKLSNFTCNPGESCDIPWIGEYTKGIYKYLLAIVGVVAAIVLMGGGVLWLVSRGEASNITQAKKLIAGSVVGTIILACSYLILLQVNSNLVNLQNIRIGVVERIDITPAPSNVKEFSEKCKAVNSGNCSVANMTGFGDKASQASGICMAESGGNATIYNSLTRCTGGEYAVWGLFQFNLSANNFIDEKGKTLKCSTAFSKPWTNSKPTCTVINKALYDACVKAAINPVLSISNAQILSNSAKTSWGPWEANSKFCNF